MNLFKIIQELMEEKKRIDRVIGALEELAKGKPLLSLESDEPAEPSTAAPAGKRKRGRPRRNPDPSGPAGSTS